MHGAFRGALTSATCGGRGTPGIGLAGIAWPMYISSGAQRTDFQGPHRGQAVYASRWPRTGGRAHRPSEGGGTGSPCTLAG